LVMEPKLLDPTQNQSLLKTALALLSIWHITLCNPTTHRTAPGASRNTKGIT